MVRSLNRLKASIKTHARLIILALGNAICYSLLGGGAYFIYEPLGLIVPGIMLWFDLFWELKRA